MQPDAVSRRLLWQYVFERQTLGEVRFCRSIAHLRAQPKQERFEIFSICRDRVFENFLDLMLLPIREVDLARQRVEHRSCSNPLLHLREALRAFSGRISKDM